MKIYYRKYPLDNDAKCHEWRECYEMKVSFYDLFGNVSIGMYG